MCNKEIKRVSTKDLYSQYKLYCGNTDVKIGTQRNFNGAMSELNFKYKTSNSKMFYNITLDELKEVARVRGWLSDMDADQMGDHVIWEERKTVAEMASENNLFFDAKSYEDIIEQKDKQLEQKDREIEELKRLLKQQQEPAEKPKKKSKRKEPKEKSKKTSDRDWETTS